MIRPPASEMLEVPAQSRPTWGDEVLGAPAALRAHAVAHAAYLHGVGQGGVHALQRARRGVFRPQRRLRATQKQRSGGDIADGFSVSWI